MKIGSKRYLASQCQTVRFGKKNEEFSKKRVHIIIEPENCDARKINLIFCLGRELDLHFAVDKNPEDGVYFTNDVFYEGSILQCITCRVNHKTRRMFIRPRICDHLMYIKQLHKRTLQIYYSKRYIADPKIIWTGWIDVELKEVFIITDTDNMTEFAKKYIWLRGVNVTLPKIYLTPPVDDKEKNKTDIEDTINIRYNQLMLFERKKTAELDKLETEYCSNYGHWGMGNFRRSGYKGVPQEPETIKWPDGKESMILSTRERSELCGKGLSHVVPKKN